MSNRELTAADFIRSICHSVRARPMKSEVVGGGDIIALRHFVGLLQ